MQLEQSLPSVGLWKILIAAFAQASEAREFELLSKLQFLKKKDTVTLAEYLNEFKSVCNQLNSIGKTDPDHRKVFSLLTNLGSSYEAFTMTMLKPLLPRPLDFSRNRTQLSHKNMFGLM